MVQILNLRLDLESVLFMKKVAIFPNGDIVFFIYMIVCAKEWVSIFYVIEKDDI